VCTLAVKKKIRAGFDMSDRTIPLLVLPSSCKGNMGKMIAVYCKTHKNITAQSRDTTFDYFCMLQLMMAISQSELEVHD
jgi:lipid A disaccharide synthetase